MKSTQSLVRGRIQQHIASALGVATLAFGASSAFAAPVDSGVLAINVPATTAGIYLNIVTGVTGATSATAGWDLNPYQASAVTGLNFFAPATGGGGYVISGTTVPPLAAGTLIGPASTFSGTGVVGAAPAFRVAGNNYVGLRLLNEATGAINYGYALISVGAGAPSPGFPAAIIRTGYCNAGETATIPASPGAPICGGGGPGPGLPSDIALFINNDAGYAVATGVAKTGSTTVNVGGSYSFFARVLNNNSGPVTGGALGVTIPATSRYDSATCSGSVAPTIPAGPINSPGPVNLTGINFTGRTNPPLVGGVVPLTCRFNFTAVAAGTGTHTGTVSQTSPGNVTTNDTDTFGITVNSAPAQTPAIPVNSLNAWGIAALAFLLGLVGFAVVRRRV